MLKDCYTFDRDEVACVAPLIDWALVEDTRMLPPGPARFDPWGNAIPFDIRYGEQRSRYVAEGVLC